jgi:hypothetical protein
MPIAFHSSCRYWQTGDLGDKKSWSVTENGDLYRAHDFKERATVLIEGDCREKLSLPDGGLVHIYGDLHKTIEIGGQGEIVIGGSVLPNAAIEADGIHHVFVGTDLNGTIRSLGSLEVWVGGNFGGHCHTGNPITQLHVGGDISGQFEPTREASLLYLDVDGFMPYETLKTASKYGYTEFNATLGFSDRAPGFYPEEWARLENRRSYCRWTIHATRTLPWGLSWESPQESQND